MLKYFDNTFFKFFFAFLAILCVSFAFLIFANVVFDGPDEPAIEASVYNES